MYIYVCIYVYICMYIYIYIFIYTYVCMYNLNQISEMLRYFIPSTLTL